MQQSNLYIISFTVLMTIFFGTLLSLTRMTLEPRQKKQEEIDTKKKILGAVVNVSEYDPEKILSIYNERMQSMVLNYDNEVVETDSKGNKIIAENINIQKNYKLDPKERMYPIFMYKNIESGDTEAYIFPMFGNGLWDWISAYVALEKDLNTVMGISFDHKIETPGLGARISSNEIQDRYKKKKIFDDTGDFISITMLKGENNKGINVHQVDGMSGATITGNGVNKMIFHYLECYSSFIEENKLDQAIKISKN